MWLIWDVAEHDWIREMPSKVQDGGVAVLAFTSKREAYRRAAEHFGHKTYGRAKALGWCLVVDLGVTCPSGPRP